MSTTPKRVAELVGMDAAIFYAVLARGWSTLSGPVTAGLVASCLTPSEVGYYYVLVSLLALQQLFELGFNQVAIQYFAYEAGSFEHSLIEGVTGGDGEARSRCRLLWDLATRWYSMLAMLILFVVGPLGFVFMSWNASNPEVAWKLPWCFMLIGAAGLTFTQPIIALATGLNYVPIVNRISMCVRVVQSLTLWVLLVCGVGLRSPGISSCIAAGAAFVLFVQAFATLKGTVKQVDGACVENTGFLRGFRKLQARTAVTWLSSFFVFQLFSPLLMSFTDAVETGRFAFSLGVLTSVCSMPLVWIQTKLPSIGSLISQGEAHLAFQTFKEAVVRTLLFSFAVVGLAMIGVHLLQKYFLTEQRFVPAVELLLFGVGLLLQNMTYCCVSYVRAHKREPFLLMAWLQATVTVAVAVALVAFAGRLGAVVAFSVSWGFAAPYSLFVLRTFLPNKRFFYAEN